MEIKDMYLSIIVPAFNEAESVIDLYHEIMATGRRLDRPFEIIFINDGSTDKTLENLRKLSPIKIINFRKNFGQTAALDAGIKAAQGRYVAALDGDGQNNPHDILKLLEKLERNDLDVVSGWRKHRQDPFLKKFFSRCAAVVRKLLVNDGVHDSGCTLKVYKKECFNYVDLVGEMHRFIPALLKIKGYKIGELEVDHRPRRTGKTKYNWKRGIKGNLDMISIWFWKKYASRPLHLFGSFGLALILISIVAGLLAVYGKIFNAQDLSDTALTELSMFGFLIGVQFFVFGLLADMLSKNYFAATKDKVYDIKEIIENK
ncbi:MAG: glycosyltransferase family 2 protein [Patescibacteria group bacterium]|nr:glycosyltransferase family 2 protein [Patescibacteria group bacterium]MDD5294680.1 glycosyltransferase family 2 protein [Patescibacteria group bacterium]MDD5554452.1 glycosyltransferase family 2 protein [Patescibacteria group bacterium]